MSESAAGPHGTTGSSRRPVPAQTEPPVLPDVPADERDEAWGEASGKPDERAEAWRERDETWGERDETWGERDQRDDEWYRRERPPHHG